jgi:hypothetical protein
MMILGKVHGVLGLLHGVQNKYMMFNTKRDKNKAVKQKSFGE